MPEGELPTITARELTRKRLAGHFEYRGWCVPDAAPHEGEPRWFVDEAYDKFDQYELRMTALPEEGLEELTGPDDVGSYGISVVYHRPAEAWEEWAEKLFKAPGQGPLEPRVRRIDVGPFDNRLKARRVYGTLASMLREAFPLDQVLEKVKKIVREMT